MRVRQGFLLIVAAAWSLFATGCGQDDSPQVEKVSAAAPEGPPETAEGAIRAVVSGLKENRLGALWDFFPASFQNDLNGLLHDFARRMDPDIWNKGVAAARKLARVLKEKQPFIRNARRGEGQGGTDWGQVAELLDTLLSSDLADLEKLKMADAGRLLAETGGQILSQVRAFSKLGQRDFFGQNLDQLANLSVSPVRSSGDSATVRFEAPDQDPEMLEFVRVEGKWIPRNLAESWHEMIHGEAQAWLGSRLAPETIAQEKPLILGFIAEFDKVLDDLLAAKTQEDFNAAGARGAQIAGTIAALAGPTEPGALDPEEEPEPGRPVGTATVIVKGQLTEEAQNELGQRLQALADPGSRSFSEITGDDESTTVQLGPVADLEAFAKKLDFLKILEVDGPTRTITAQAK